MPKLYLVLLKGDKGLLPLQYLEFFINWLFSSLDLSSYFCLYSFMFLFFLDVPVCHHCCVSFFRCSCFQMFLFSSVPVFLFSDVPFSSVPVFQMFLFSDVPFFPVFRCSFFLCSCFQMFLFSSVPVSLFLLSER